LPVKRAHFGAPDNGYCGKACSHDSLRGDVKLAISKVASQLAGCAEPVFPLCSRPSTSRQ
jgi:hypothetical protein